MAQHCNWFLIDIYLRHIWQAARFMIELGKCFDCTDTPNTSVILIYLHVLNINLVSLYCFLSVQYLNYISVFQIIALNIFYKQHIKTYVLSKTLKISPTCFGHLATILREIRYLSLLQVLNYRSSSMPAAMCVLGPVLTGQDRTQHTHCSVIRTLLVLFVYWLTTGFTISL